MAKAEHEPAHMHNPSSLQRLNVIANPQSFNRYSYVENDQVNFIDPSGLQMRSYDVYAGLSCVFDERDGKFHCIENIYRYWYDDGTGYGGSNGLGVIDLFGGSRGGGNTTGGEGPQKPNRAQCDAIRELLRREKEYGTSVAAMTAAEEAGKVVKVKGKDGKPLPRLAALRNEFNGILWIGDSPLDADWLLTLYSTRTKANNRAYGTQIATYAVGKSLWSLSKWWSGQESQNPIPFTEAGERNAIYYAEGGYKFSEIFTESWLKENCD